MILVNLSVVYTCNAECFLSQLFHLSGGVKMWNVKQLYSKARKAPEEACMLVSRSALR